MMENSQYKRCIITHFAVLEVWWFQRAIPWLNYGTDAQAGAGISMMAQISFALGVLSLLGNRVPLSLKYF
jgi:hypothetical protein